MFCQIRSPLWLLFSYEVLSDSLWPQGLHHARVPCHSSSPGACSNSCPSSWWRHSAISPSVALFSFCPQSFLASGSFPVSWLFTSCGQSKISSVARKYIKKWIPFFKFHYFKLSANINGMHVNNFIIGKFIQRVKKNEICTSFFKIWTWQVILPDKPSKV